MENSWTKAANEGKKVEVKIKPIYEGSSKRPSEFRVEYTIDNVKPNIEKFKNGDKEVRPLDKFLGINISYRF